MIADKYKNEPLIRFPATFNEYPMGYYTQSEPYKVNTWNDVLDKVEMMQIENLSVEKICIEERIRKVEKILDIYHTILIGNASQIYLYKEHKADYDAGRHDFNASIAKAVGFNYCAYLKQKGINTICNSFFVHKNICGKFYSRYIHHYELITFRESK